MKPYVSDPDFTLYHGDVLDVLRQMPDESVDCCVTSPPYWGLRDYSTRGQLGLEPTPEQYVERMVEVFREVRRVLAGHGTCWVNMGDSYADANRHADKRAKDASGVTRPRALKECERCGEKFEAALGRRFCSAFCGGSDNSARRDRPGGLKAKDLCGIPWRLAFALQADGWYLRSDIIWAKSNPMPESVTDRPTKAHEYVFLLTKSPRYFFDQEAVREPHQYDGRTKLVHDHAVNGSHENYAHMGTAQERWPNSGRNIRSVWEIATQPFPEAHFATFPEELVRRCLLAGCPEQVCGECGKARERVVEVTAEYAAEKARLRGRLGPDFHMKRAGLDAIKGTGTGGNPRTLPQKNSTLGFTDCGHDAYRPGIVLDPFMGSGTTALVARKHNRRAVGIELNPDYCAMAAKRLSQLSLLA